MEVASIRIVDKIMLTSYYLRPDGLSLRSIKDHVLNLAKHSYPDLEYDSVGVFYKAFMIAEDSELLSVIELEDGCDLTLTVLDITKMENISVCDEVALPDGYGTVPDIDQFQDQSVVTNSTSISEASVSETVPCMGKVAAIQCNMMDVDHVTTPLSHSSLFVAAENFQLQSNSSIILTMKTADVRLVKHERNELILQLDVTFENVGTSLRNLDDLKVVFDELPLANNERYFLTFRQHIQHFTIVSEPFSQRDHPKFSSEGPLNLRKFLLSIEGFLDMCKLYQHSMTINYEFYGDSTDEKDNAEEGCIGFKFNLLDPTNNNAILLREPVTIVYPLKDILAKTKKQPQRLNAETTAAASFGEIDINEDVVDIGCTAVIENTITDALFTSSTATDTVAATISNIAGSKSFVAEAATDSATTATATTTTTTATTKTTTTTTNCNGSSYDFATMATTTSTATTNAATYSTTYTNNGIAGATATISIGLGVGGLTSTTITNTKYATMTETATCSTTVESQSSPDHSSHEHATTKSNVYSKVVWRPPQLQTFTFDNIGSDCNPDFTADASGTVYVGKVEKHQENVSPTFVDDDVDSWSIVTSDSDTSPAMDVNKSMDETHDNDGKQSPKAFFCLPDVDIDAQINDDNGSVLMADVSYSHEVDHDTQHDKVSQQTGNLYEQECSSLQQSTESNFKYEYLGSDAFMTSMVALMNMGFCDRSLNRKYLKEYDNDLVKVVSALTEGPTL